MLSPVRFARLAVSSLRLVHDPERLDMVFSMVDALSSEEDYERMRAHLATHPRGAAALEQRPLLGDIDLEALARLPVGSVGRAFADFAQEHGIEPRVLTDEARRKDEYVSIHLYETHDLWHVATGFDTDLLGELRLQAFYMAQHPWERLAPVLMGLALLKTALQEDEYERPFPAWHALEAMADGWSRGRAAEPMFGLRWADRWEQPLAELQQELGLAA